MEVMNIQLTHGQCRICGYWPSTEKDEPNYEPVRWWDADDGWKIGALCRQCWIDAKRLRPQPDDYAYFKTNGICDVEDTDLDPTIAL